jgi:hypothetical protein
LHSEEIQNLFSSLNIIWMFKWKGMWWAGYVAHIGEKINSYGFFLFWIRYPLILL